MTIRAVIFDIYDTLLEVRPPPADAETRWQQLWHEMLGAPARITLQEFAARCDGQIDREHTAARAAGVPHPEVFWPDIVGEVVPELGRLATGARDEFMFQQARLWHTVRLMPGAAEALRELRQRGLVLGLASNSQPYTLRELDEALASVSLDRSVFASGLCFFSFEHGFSKPDPHVFRLLTARLRARGISADETLMVGDRLENDLEPARRQGWQTWRLTRCPASSEADSGDWALLARHCSVHSS
ncbi:MAG: HAD family hydrolase [Chloroflexi bacterium]|nr:HAD family hydrolase [Chloroflexota bacterium]